MLQIQPFRVLAMGQADDLPPSAVKVFQDCREDRSEKPLSKGGMEPQHAEFPVSDRPVDDGQVTLDLITLAPLYAFVQAGCVWEFPDAGIVQAGIRQRVSLIGPEACVAKPRQV